MANGFINKEIVDFENSIYDGSNKKAIAQAHADLYDIFNEDDFK